MPRFGEGGIEEGGVSRTCELWACDEDDWAPALDDDVEETELFRSTSAATDCTAFSVVVEFETARTLALTAGAGGLIETADGDFRMMRPTGVSASSEECEATRRN